MDKSFEYNMKEADCEKLQKNHKNLIIFKFLIKY